MFRSRLFSAVPSKRVQERVQDASVLDTTRNIGIIAHIDAVSIHKKYLGRIASPS